LRYQLLRQKQQRTNLNLKGPININLRVVKFIVEDVLHAERKVAIQL